MGIVTAAVYGETFSMPTSISYNYPYDPFATPTTIQSSPSVPNTSGITALLALEIVYSVLVVLASCAGLYGVLKEKGKWVYWFAMSFYAAAVLGLIFGITTVALIVSLENQLCNGLPFCPIPAPVGNIVSMIFAFLFNLKTGVIGIAIVTAVVHAFQAWERRQQTTIYRRLEAEHDLAGLCTLYNMIGYYALWALLNNLIDLYGILTSKARLVRWYKMWALSAFLTNQAVHLASITVLRSQWKVLTSLKTELEDPPGIDYVAIMMDFPLSRDELSASHQVKKERAPPKVNKMPFFAYCCCCIPLKAGVVLLALYHIVTRIHLAILHGKALVVCLRIFATFGGWCTLATGPLVYCVIWILEAVMALYGAFTVNVNSNDESRILNACVKERKMGMFVQRVLLDYYATPVCDVMGGCNLFSRKYPFILLESVISVYTGLCAHSLGRKFNATTATTQPPKSKANPEDGEFK
ncbi:hypothetical protein BZG36_02514 [Bifiguratus adelaidae]|uniref:Uncharacterized protein n=1 Tax=Bifiguratus adelaidae TaxID=1938954 RepID=A0A261Y328_9FUNG|nr:hypothetical protein BZG36_02514 [Bifiguratus adelaidae]